MSLAHTAIDETGRVKVIASDGTFEYLPEPPPPVFVRPLSPDAKIGLGFLFCVLAYTRFDPVVMLWFGAVFAVIVAWRWLNRAAPVTSYVIFCIFGIILLALLGGRGRRW